jgi:hypothetical protein
VSLDLTQGDSHHLQRRKWGFVQRGHPRNIGQRTEGKCALTQDFHFLQGPKEVIRDERKLSKAEGNDSGHFWEIVWDRERERERERERPGQERSRRLWGATVNFRLIFATRAWLSNRGGQIRFIDLVVLFPKLGCVCMCVRVCVLCHTTPHNSSEAHI